MSQENLCQPGCGQEGGSSGVVHVSALKRVYIRHNRVAWIFHDLVACPLQDTVDKLGGEPHVVDIVVLMHRIEEVGAAFDD